MMRRRTHVLGPQSLRPFLSESAFAAILGEDQKRPSAFVQVMSFMPCRNGQNAFFKVNDGECWVTAYVMGEDAQRSVRDNTMSDSNPEDFDNTPERGCLLRIQKYKWSTKQELVPNDNHADGAGDSSTELCLAIHGKVINIGGHGIGLIQGLVDLHETTRVKQALLNIHHHIPTLRTNLQQQSFPRNNSGQPHENKLNEDAEASPSASRRGDPTETVTATLFDAEEATLGDVHTLLNNGGTQLFDQIVATAEREAQIEEETVPLGDVQNLLNQGGTNLLFDRLVATAERDEQVEEETVPLGDVQNLLNQGGSNLFDRLVATAEREAQMEEETIPLGDVLKHGGTIVSDAIVTAAEPDAQTEEEESNEAGQHSAGNTATSNKSHEDTQVFSKENLAHNAEMVVATTGFAVYTATGDVADRITDPKEMQTLMSKVLDIHEKEAGVNSQLSEEEKIMDDIGDKAIHVDKSSEKLGGEENPISFNSKPKAASTTVVTSPPLVVNPYRKRSQIDKGDKGLARKSSVDVAALKKNRDSTSRLTGSSPIEHLTASPLHHLPRPCGISAMLLSDGSEDEDSREKDDVETNHNNDAYRISRNSKNTAVEQHAVEGSKELTVVETGARNVEEDTQVDSTDPDASPGYARNQGEGKNGVGDAIVPVSKEPTDARPESDANRGPQHSDDSSTSSTDTECQARDNHNPSVSSNISIENDCRNGGSHVGTDMQASNADDFSNTSSARNSSTESEAFYTAKQGSKDSLTTVMNEDMDGNANPITNDGSASPEAKSPGAKAQHNDVAHLANQPRSSGNLERRCSNPLLASRPVLRGDRLRRSMVELDRRSSTLSRNKPEQWAEKTGARQSTDRAALHRKKSRKGRPSGRQEPQLDFAWLSSVSFSRINEGTSSFNARSAANEGSASHPARGKALRSSYPPVDKASNNPSGRDERSWIRDEYHTKSQRQQAKQQLKLVRNPMLRPPPGESVPPLQTALRGKDKLIAAVRQRSSPIIPAKGRTQKYANKTTFLKFFGRHGTYVGSVKSYNPATGFYCVRYEDSDEE
jgi:hypothetical protein